jgi:hypothetical protein
MHASRSDYERVRDTLRVGVSVQISNSNVPAAHALAFRRASEDGTPVGFPDFDGYWFKVSQIVLFPGPSTYGVSAVVRCIHAPGDGRFEQEERPWTDTSEWTYD